MKQARQSTVLPNYLFDLDRLKVSHDLCLNWDLDQVLQDIVAEASREHQFPISLVSIVLKNIQFFKASVGLPPGLATSQATDRCSSFCQFVVQTGEVVCIEDTNEFPDLPLALVESYGIRSYCGIPVSVNGEVVGSLCVIDTKPRQMSIEMQNALSKLALKVNARLEVLTAEMQKPPGLLRKIAAPTFGEIRNLLAAASMNFELGDVYLTNAKPLFRLLESYQLGKLSHEEFKKNFDVLESSLQSAKELSRIQETQKRIANLLSETMIAFEKALVDERYILTDIVKAVQAAETISFHQTKLVGGVVWHHLPSQPVWARANQQQFVILVSFTLNLIVDLVTASKKVSSGIKINYSQDVDNAVFYFNCELLSESDWLNIFRTISVFAALQDVAEINVVGAGLEFKVHLKN